MVYYIIIRGPLGSGKSTISQELAKRIDAEVMSVDGILDEFRLTKDKEEGYISQKSFKKANEIAVERAKPFLDSGRPVIFDGNFYWKSQIEDLEERLQYKHLLFTLNVPLEVCIQRDSNRDPPHGEAAARVVYKKTMSFEIGISIDAAQSKDKIVDDIFKILNMD